MKNQKENEFTYSKIEPASDFAPWLSDKKFLNVFNLIKNDSYVDVYRCFELWKLVEESIKINPEGSILEVGVWRGGTAGIIAEKLLNLGVSNKLFLADTFFGVVKASKIDNVYVGGEHTDTTVDIVNDLLIKKIGFSNYVLLEGVFPDETASKIPKGETFSFCHLDVDVYLSTKDIVEWLFDKLLIGGVIVFDDYGFEICAGVTKFVEEQRTLKDRLIIHNLNGHAIIVKIA